MTTDVLDDSSLRHVRGRNGFVTGVVQAPL